LPLSCLSVVIFLSAATFTQHFFANVAGRSSR
jgi:hypothetical protein